VLCVDLGHALKTVRQVRSEQAGNIARAEVLSYKNGIARRTMSLVCLIVYFLISLIEDEQSVAVDSQAKWGKGRHSLRRAQRVGNE
jgi:hypothetical protein